MRHLLRNTFKKKLREADIRQTRIHHGSRTTPERRKEQREKCKSFELTRIVNRNNDPSYIFEQHIN